MQEEEARAAAGRAFVARVEPRDAGPSAASERVVSGHVSAVRVGPVGEKGEAEVAFGVGEVVDLEPFELLVELAAFVSSVGTATSVRSSGGTPCASSSLGSRRGGEQRRDQAMDERDRDVGGRHEPRSASRTSAEARRTGGARERTGAKSWSAVSEGIPSEVGRERVPAERARSQRRSWKRKPRRRSKSLRPAEMR